jgi:ribosome-associated protein
MPFLRLPEARDILGSMDERPLSDLVPDAELSFRSSRAGGPGGQHVNKASTRVEVRWDVLHSPSLDEARRRLLLKRLGSRISASGILRVVASGRRSQLQNRLAAVERLRALVARALHEAPPRRPTRPPRTARERRLAQKRRRAELKARRRPVDVSDD